MKVVKTEGKSRIVENNLYSFKYMWNKSKKYVILQMFSVVFEGLQGPLKVLLSAWLFNLLDKGGGFREALSIVALIMAVTVIYNVWGWTFDYAIMPKLWKRLQFKIQSELLKKTETIELKEYDDPDFYDEYLIVIQEADEHISSSIDNMKSFVSAVLTIVATAGLFTYVSPVVFAILFIAAIVSLVNNIRKEKIDYESKVKSAGYRKKEQYHGRIYRLVEYTKELRSSRINEALLNDLENNNRQYIRHMKKYGRKKVLYQIIDSAVFYLSFAAIIICALYRIRVSGTLFIGAFAIVINTNWQFRNALRSFGDTISELSKESLYIEKIRNFMKREEKTSDKKVCLPKIESIQLDEVSFGYSDDEKVLDGINMTIKGGEHIAIVGENGAGKSTLIKLILGLYLPTSGRVLINGKDIHDIKQEEFKKHFGVAFQDYQVFAASLAENVLGDVYEDRHKKLVEDSLRIATLESKTDTLPNGIFSMMTREFDEDGILLSGGETQKVAIARAFAARGDVMIMDEPSASLDAISEEKLMTNIETFSRDKAVITISHRLSTTRKADVIYVLDNGRIIEKGKHEELMALNGRYAQFFNAQASKYRSPKEVI